MQTRISSIAAAATTIASTKMDSTTKPIPSLETLPAEIRLLIFLALPDPTTLRALVHASPTYHSTYSANRNLIFTAITLRSLTARRIDILYPLRFAEVLLPRQHTACSPTLWSALSSISTQSSTSARKPIELTIDECLALLHLVDVVAWWVDPANGAVRCARTMEQDHRRPAEDKCYQLLAFGQYRFLSSSLGSMEGATRGAMIRALLQNEGAVWRGKGSGEAEVHWEAETWDERVERGGHVDG